MDIEKVRGALLTTLVQKRGVEQQLERLERQAEALMNQLAVLEQLESTDGQSASMMKEPPSKEEETSHGSD